MPDSKTEINQTGFNSAADDIATEYGKEKQLAKAEIADLLDSLKKKWKEFKAELA